MNWNHVYIFSVNCEWSNWSSYSSCSCCCVDTKELEENGGGGFVKVSSVVFQKKWTLLFSIQGILWIFEYIVLSQCLIFTKVLNNWTTFLPEYFKKMNMGAKITWVFCLNMWIWWVGTCFSKKIVPLFRLNLMNTWIWEFFQWTKKLDIF